MTPEQTAAVNDIIDGVQLILKGGVALSKTTKDDEILAKLQPLVDAAQSFLLKESDG